MDPAPQQQGYTCITCRVVFVDPELQRAHYKTDWHRYNLKRKVAELAPVTADDFQRRVLAQQAADKDSEPRRGEFCRACKKRFTSRESYDSHVRSRKHRDRAAAGGGEAGNGAGAQMREAAEEMEVDKHATEKAVDTNKLDEDEIETDDEPEPLDATECLFCSETSGDLETNLEHMTLAHGFFLPDLTYLADVEGLVSYLGEKVGVGFMCLYCNERGRAFLSARSAQQHMVDKSHCKMYFEAEAALEYAEFYDYTKSYPNGGEDPMEEGSGKALAIPDANLEVTEDLELVLPSGARVGHRSLRHLYRQHLPSDERRRSTLVSRLLVQYRAIGWKGGSVDEVSARSERDVSWARRMQAAREVKLGVKANKLQKHFRPQVIF